MGASNIIARGCMGGFCTQRMRCAHYLPPHARLEDGNLCAPGTSSAFEPIGHEAAQARAEGPYTPEGHAAWREQAHLQAQRENAEHAHLLASIEAGSPEPRPRPILRTQPHSRWPSNSLI